MADAAVASQSSAGADADNMGPRIDWATIELPDAWPDAALRGGALHALDVVRAVFRARHPVTFPPGLPGADGLPGYLRQEFHHLPNGLYSKRIAKGYSRGFEWVMLGHMRAVRQRVADALRGCSAVADIGCGAGGLASALVTAGIPDVWAIDPSPYLLQIAARRLSGVRVVQGLAERTGLAAGQLDGVGLTYVFHELPARAVDDAFAEMRRILRPGGRLAFAEPSVLHYYAGVGAVLRAAGLRGVYYRALARLVHEPFVKQWHLRDMSGSLAAAGFRVLAQEDRTPSRFVLAART